MEDLMVNIGFSFAFTLNSQLKFKSSSNYLFLLLTAGRALEDFRASLFNQFRSSEGAKHQQQHICGPAIALSFNFLVAVGIIFMNKMVCLLSFYLLTG